MAHTHEHHSHSQNGLSLAFWLNLLFSAVEAAGGIFTNSTAIIADAFHDFMDAMAIGLAVFLEKTAGKKRTPGFSYGYKRFSLLAALGMSLFLAVGAAWMAISAIGSFNTPKEVNSTGMMWLALLGLAINGVAFLRIRNGEIGHNHHHGHDHMHTHNHNSRAIRLHLLEDVLGWAAVLAGAGVIYFTGWYWIDGVLALMIAVFIGFNATRNLIGTLKVLLQSVPDGVNTEAMTNDLLQVNGIRDIHDVHVWSLDGSYHVASLHAVVDDPGRRDEDAIRKMIIDLMKKYHIQHPTVQIERRSDRYGCVECR